MHDRSSVRKGVDDRIVTSTEGVCCAGKLIAVEEPVKNEHELHVSTDPM